MGINIGSDRPMRRIRHRVLPEVVDLELCPAAVRNVDLGRAWSRSKDLGVFDRNDGTLELQMRLWMVRTTVYDQLDDLHEDFCASRLRRANSTEPSRS